MNRIFRVIWNHATQTWTAVGELASAKGKSKSVKLAAISTALLAVVAGGAQAAQEVVMKAEDRGGLAIGTSTVSAQFYGNADYKAKTGLTENKVGAKVNAYDGIAIGNGALSGSNSGTAGNAHIAIGLMSQATGNTANGKVGDGANAQNAAVALGAYSLATGQGGTAIGAHAVASDLNSTALGKIAHANGASSTAVGQQSQAVQRATATGAESKALAPHSTAVGERSKVNSGNSIAVGSNAKVETGQNSVTVGSNTEIRGNKIASVGANSNIKSANVSTLGADITVGTGRDGAVVLGHESSADDKVIAVNSAKIGDNSKLTYTGFAGNLGGTNNNGKNTAAAKDKQGNFVSVGSEDNERQIKHVAAGRITADSTDALNGSQLYSVAKTLGNAAEGLADTLGVDLNEDGTVKNKFSQPLTVAEGSDYTAPADAGDVKTALTNLNNYVNAGWNVTASGNDYKNNVSVGHTVNFVGSGNVDVDGSTIDGVRTVNISVDSPLDYASTKAEVDGNEVDVVKANDGKWYPKDKVDEDNNPKEGAASIPSSDIVKKGAKLTDSDTENNPYEKGNSYTYDDKGNITATGYDKTKPESKDEITAGKNGVQLNNVGWATQPDQAVNKDQLDQTVNKSGFYVQQNGKSTLDAKTDSDKVSDTEKVTPNDVVNFVNGNGTVIKAVTTRDANGVDTTNVTFNVDMAEITPDSDGSVNGPVPQNLLDALDAAQAKVDENPDDEEAKKALEAAQDAVNKAGGNKVANAQNVADMINSSGFTLKTSATADGKKESGDDEIINPGKTVEMIAGKNLTVKQEANGKVTYSMKDDVEFTSVKVGEDKDGKKPVNFTTEKATDASNNDPANKPTTALNVSSSDGKPTQITGVGSTLNVKPVDTNTNGTPTADADKPKLVDLVGTDAAPVNKNAAATVGDLQNMGWVVSTKDGNGYTDVVKNANQVDFKGTGLATVTGETDKDGIRTITVNVDAQKTVEAAQTPVVYTNKDGDKLVKVGDKFYKAGDVVNGKPKENAEAVSNGDVIASMNNGDNKTKEPIQLANVGSNLPTVNDTTKQAFDPNSTEPKAGKDNKSAPITAKEAAAIAKKAGNNAATVSDVLNAGWNLQNNGEARDFVKPYDTVNFVNGIGTVAVVETNDETATSNVTFNVDMAEITPETDGSVNGPVPQNLLDALDKAQEEVEKNPNDEGAKKALEAAQDAVNKAGGNKVANAQNVADMINSSGFTLKTSATADGKKESGDDEIINPGKTVEMIAGKNLTVKQEANGKVTYSMKDDVEFTSVKVGEDKDGKKPVNFTTEKATDASNNDPANKPTTALNVSSSDGKPTQITGVGSVLDTADVNTSTGDQRDANGNVTTPAKEAKDKLVNLGTNLKKGDKPLSEETLNSAATVRDLANMGWVVSAKDNNYTNTVKNANKVEFKGDKGISVTGKDVTQKDGTVTREITVAIADGKVTDKVTITKDGKDIPAIKIGDNYYEVDKNGKPVGYEVDEKGKPTANNKPIDVDGATITNEGNKVVTGNTVATAIQESGWNVGLANTADADKAFNDADKALSATKLEKVNPNDNVRFADGKGTKAAVATVERVDEFGKKVTDTYVKFDVDAGKITADTTKPGVVKGLVTAKEAEKLADDLKKAEQAVKDLPADATPEAKKAAQDVLKVAQDAAAPLNKVATAQNVAEAINNSGWRTNSKTATGGAKDTLINPGKAVNFESGKNMEVAQTVDKDGNVAYTYATKDDVQFNSVQLGDNGPKLTNNGNDLKVSGSNGTDPVKITNIADGNISANSKDAVNGSQLHATNVQVNKNAQNINRVEGKVDNLSQVINNHAGEFNRLDRKVNKYGKEARAGIAGANAAAGLPQVYIPGKSMVAASAGTYKGQSALAVGYSRASDNGQLILKLQGNANTRGDVGGSVGVGYQW